MNLLNFYGTNCEEVIRCRDNKYNFFKKHINVLKTLTPGQKKLANLIDNNKKLMVVPDRQVGTSTFLKATAIHEFLFTNKTTLYITDRMTTKQMVTLSILETLKEISPYIQPRLLSVNSRKIESETGSQIIFSTEDMILDEIKNKKYYHIILDTIGYFSTEDMIKDPQKKTTQENKLIESINYLDKQNVGKVTIITNNNFVNRIMIISKPEQINIV